MGMGIAETGGKRRQVSPSMNVTPLVDVVLVLLIIFMVVTPLLSKQFWLHLPKPDTSAAPPPDSNDSIVLSVDKAGTIRVNSTVIPKEELKDRMAGYMAPREVKMIYFDAHDEAPYQAALEAMDLARLGGAKHIAILTENIVK
jgi:biopolymer transport protein ExbD/biopolymer transport protein TolR